MQEDASGLGHTLENPKMTETVTSGSRVASSSSLPSYNGSTSSSAPLSNNDKENQDVAPKEAEKLSSTIQANSTSTSSHANIDVQATKRAKLVNPDPVNVDRLGFIHRNKSNSNKPLRGVLKNNSKGVHSNPADHQEIIQSSPLLTSTPPSISRALIRLYPYLIVFDKILSLLTWTGEDIWGSVLLLCIYITINLYFQNIVTYFGHLTCVLLLWLYSNLDRIVGTEMEERPTLDDIIHTVSSVSSKFDLLLSPIAVLTTSDIKRLLITTVFLSPIYMILTVFFLPKGNLMLLLGVIGLSYHSSWSRVTRKMLWKSKTIRLFCFYITGLDIDGIKSYKALKGKTSGHNSLSSTFATGGSTSTGLFSTVQKKLLKSNRENESSYDNKPIRFTYVLYENQRRWLGIGWTANMLSYERSCWTDEFLNEAPDPDNFKLPDDSSSGMIWRWIDKTWRLDISNDGAIQVPASRSKTTASPSADDGFIYYDNTWKKPAIDDTYSKYTRRRRWVRTAELIKVSDTPMPHQPSLSEATIESQGVSVQVASANTTGADRKNLSDAANLHQPGNRLSANNIVDGMEKSQGTLQSQKPRKVSFSTTENVIPYGQDYMTSNRNRDSAHFPTTPEGSENETSHNGASSSSEILQNLQEEPDIKHRKQPSTNNIKYTFSSSNNNSELEPQNSSLNTTNDIE